LFCYTVACSIECVTQEMLLWSRISSEHPSFLLTVARLTGKRLSKSIVDELKKADGKFEENHDCVKRFADMLYGGHKDIQSDGVDIKVCMRKFLSADKDFIETLIKLKEYGKKDGVWQALIEHIEKEQRYMYRLVETLLMQMA